MWYRIGRDYFVPQYCREEKYCDQRTCMFVCQRAYLKNQCLNFTKFSTHVAYDCGSVLLWRWRCVLTTSGFVITSCLHTVTAIRMLKLTHQGLAPGWGRSLISMICLNLISSTNTIHCGLVVSRLMLIQYSCCVRLKRTLQKNVKPRARFLSKINRFGLLELPRLTVYSC